VRASVKDAVSGQGCHQRGVEASQERRDGWLLDTGPACSPLASQMRRETAKKAPKQHYPTSYAPIDLWVKHGGDHAAMQKAEMANAASHPSLKGALTHHRGQTEARKQRLNRYSRSMAPTRTPTRIRPCRR
jgi:hypothetical protein